MRRSVLSALASVALLVLTIVPAHAQQTINFGTFTLPATSTGYFVDSGAQTPGNGQAVQAGNATFDLAVDMANLPSADQITYEEWWFFPQINTNTGQPYGWLLSLVNTCNGGTQPHKSTQPATTIVHLSGNIPGSIADDGWPGYPTKADIKIDVNPVSFRTTATLTLI